MATLTCMPDKKSTPKDADRHKPSRHVRIKVQLAEQLDRLALRNATSTPDEVNRAVRELLEREGLWPLKDGRK